MLSQADRTLARYPMLKYLMDEPAWDSKFLTSVRTQFIRSGFLSHTQAITACRIISEERAKKHYMKERSEEIISSGLIIPTGWTTITGIIKSIKWQLKGYKMLTDGFDGYRVYGNIPGFLFMDFQNNLDDLRGRVVTFEADIEPKGEDFAIYLNSRPAVQKERSSSRV
jgi:hypothetical protein